SNNLSTWESPSTFIQVDSAAGYPLAKTANLGASRIPPNTSLAPHESAFREVSLGGRRFLVEDRILSSGGVAAIVHVADPLDALNRTYAQTRRAIFFILIAAVLAVVGLSILLAAQAIDPITRLSKEMRELRSDRLDLRLNWPPRNDEIGELTKSFDDLLARLDEAFARERQFISDASHELKTPLTSINANAQLLLRWGDRDPTILRESLETIVAESASLAGMVNGMLTLAKADRGDEIPKDPVDLRAIAGDTVRGAMQRASEKKISLAIDTPDEPVLVFGSSSLLRQLIGNLIDNAIKFTETGGIDVRVNGDERWAWIDVEDSGPGIPEEEWPHVFERFYRADKARSREVPGTGLGLAIVRSIARVHDGTVTVSAGARGGARFRASFPRMRDSLTAIS
ncbi:MAG TPA: HAMP domain-containing sensor histidine kinase, partial [Candidatus Baltobacteraceae bacterium]|nr:HAMP domain-containing sensor histidine kinase [Candidatus Baltobacteraceae bacterium]